MLKKAATLAVAMAAVAVSGIASDAEARRGGVHVYVGPRHHHRHYVRPIVPIYPLVSSCDYSRTMWRRTGRTYWKIRYYDCMGW